MTDRDQRARIMRALEVLGSGATRGDLVMATGLPGAEVDATLDALLAADLVQVVVFESGVLVYRLDGRAGPARTSPGHRPRPLASRDAKTLRLLRARGGVVSLAELVEHTGLTVAEAEREAQRLVELYGGELHPSWDGHVVYAFPGLLESAHGDFHVREPRPAWIWAADPMEASRRRISGRWWRWLLRADLTRAIAKSLSALRARHPWLRPRRARTVRRYLLGHVFETALRGKGVVSVRRAHAYLRARTGVRASRRAVERALRALAREFDAPITELDGDLFFGFRNVKRQFLASHVQRVRLALTRKAEGRTVFDSGDSDLARSTRELEDFDRALAEPAIPLNGDETPPRIGA